MGKKLFKYGNKTFLFNDKIVFGPFDIRTLISFFVLIVFPVLFIVFELFIK